MKPGLWATHWSALSSSTGAWHWNGAAGLREEGACHSSASLSLQPAAGRLWQKSSNMICGCCITQRRIGAPACKTWRQSNSKDWTRWAKPERFFSFLSSWSPVLWTLTTFPVPCFQRRRKVRLVQAYISLSLYCSFLCTLDCSQYSNCVTVVVDFFGLLTWRQKDGAVYFPGVPYSHISIFLDLPPWAATLGHSVVKVLPTPHPLRESRLAYSRDLS